MTNPALQRIDYLEATLLMFARDLAGEHDVGFQAAIKELARVARQAHAPSAPPTHKWELYHQGELIEEGTTNAEETHIHVDVPGGGYYELHVDPLTPSAPPPTPSQP